MKWNEIQRRNWYSKRIYSQCVRHLAAQSFSSCLKWKFCWLHYYFFFVPFHPARCICERRSDVQNYFAFAIYAKKQTVVQSLWNPYKIRVKCVVDALMHSAHVIYDIRSQQTNTENNPVGYWNSIGESKPFFLFFSLFRLQCQRAQRTCERFRILHFSFGSTCSVPTADINAKCGDQVKDDSF